MTIPAAAIDRNAQAVYYYLRYRAVAAA